MDRVQQNGGALDLVDDDPGPGAESVEATGEGAGLADELDEHRFVQKIEGGGRVGEVLGQPAALPRSAGSEEEERAVRRDQQARNEIVGHVVIFPGQMTVQQ